MTAKFYKMSQFWHKLLLVPLALLLLAVAPNTLLAQELGDKFKEGDFYYRITSLTPQEVAVVPQNDAAPYWSNHEQPNGNISIPETVAHEGQSYTVTTIGEYALHSCSDVSSIAIPGTVTSIADYAFYGCIALTEVIIPNSVTTIGASVFYNCTALNTITLPNSVVAIGNYAFRGCANLTSVAIPNSITSIGNYAFFNCSALSAIIVHKENVAGISYGGSSVFAGVATATCHLYVPDGAVDDYSATAPWNGFTNILPLSGMVPVTGVTISPTAQTIVVNEELTITATVIPEDASNKGVILTSENSDIVRIIGKNKVIGLHAGTTTITATSADGGHIATCEITVAISVGDKFKVGELRYQVRSLSPNQVAVTPGDWSDTDNTGKPTGDIIIPENVTFGNDNYTVTTVGNTAFAYCYDITNVTIPGTVTSIEMGAFYECTNLYAVNIPNTVTSIESYAFYNCTSLTAITLPNSISKIAMYTFYNCTSLSSVTIPNSVTIIDEAAFHYCTSLTSITIPNSVTGLGKWAINSCVSLSTIISYIENVEEVWMGPFVFWGSNLNTCKLFVPNGKEANYRAASQWNEFVNILPISDILPVSGISLNTTAKTIGINEKFTLIPIIDPEEADIPSVIWTSSNPSVAPINIAGEVIGLTPGTTTITATTIDGGFEASCEITVINFTVGSERFEVDGLYYMVTNVSPWCVAAVSQYEYIDRWSSGWDTPPTGNVIIPESVTHEGQNYPVTTIGDYAFHRCTGITTITIPNSITSIGEGAFQNCWSLTTLSIPNSVTSIGDYAFFLCDNISTVTIPESVTYIGENAFRQLYNLTNIFSYINNVADVHLGDGVFESIPTGTCILYVPNGTEFSYRTANQWKEFVNILPLVPVTGISLSETSKTIGITEEFTLTATVEPSNASNKAVSWRSSNNAVATVKDGKVTGIAPGTATITATTFAGGFEAECEVTVLVSYTLSYTAGEGGSISGQATQTVTHGTNGTEVEAVPNEGYQFVKWSDGVTTATRTDINVTADITVEAEFAINTYTLTYTTDANGSIEGEAIQTVEYGEDGTQVEAVANEGYHFVGWSDGVTTATRTDISVTADITVEAQFAINTYTLTYTEGEGGSIFGDATQTVAHGEDGTQVEAVANEGYHFVGWSDGVSTATRTDINVTADITVEAEFAINTYTLTYTAGEGGSIFGDATQTVLEGEDGTEVEAVAYEGYHFVKWSDGVTTATRTDINVTADILVEAEFAVSIKFKVGDLYYRTTSLLTVDVAPQNDEWPYWDDSEEPTGSITIPETITHEGQGYTVSGIGDNAFHMCTSLTTLSLPNSVTDIRDLAFYGCTGLTTLSLPNSVTGIGSFAFWECTGLITLYIPGSVIDIGDYAFHYCTSLTGIFSYIENVAGVSMGDDVFLSVPTATCTLYVPDGKVEEYRAAEQWSEFANILPMSAHVPVTGISLSETTKTIGIAEEFTLTPTVEPSDATYSTISWRSSNEAIATVEDGKVTGIAPGTATITATTIEGGFEAECEVEVLNRYTLTYTAGTGGTIFGDATQTVLEGEDGTEVEAVADEGYHFVGWSDGVSTAMRTDINVTADITVEAEFVISTYTLTYTAGTGGSIFGDATQTVLEGEDGTEVEAVADEGYHFVGWSDGVSTAMRTDINVTADISVTAWFEIAENPVYLLTFVIKNQYNNPVVDAIIEINNETLTTDSEGQATILLTNGVYSYTVTGADFEPVSGSVTINGKDEYEFISLVTVGETVGQMDKLNAYPNPFINEVGFSSSSEIKRVVITNLIGQVVISIDYPKGFVCTSSWKSGIYLFKFEDVNGNLSVRKMIKR